MATPRMCACCFDCSRTDIGQFICPRCIKQWKVIVRLYTIAAIKFPSIKKLEVDEFVLTLWEKLGLDKPKDLRYTNKSKGRKP